MNPRPDISALARRATAYFEDLQGAICRSLEELEPSARFRSDPWTHREGGGGLTRVIEGGTVFEKGGVNTSAVSGLLPASIAEKLHVSPVPFFATGISLVLHPLNPMVPTVHANLRFFEREGGDCWFGGGVDLTPFYPFEEDIAAFHAVLKSACDRHGAELHARYKKWCDEYFMIQHRGETRGVGGIFFDDLRGDGEALFAFVRSIGETFLPAYRPIVQRRRDEPWGEAERSWQLHRRGRYVEFNLVYDRGTVFGLETGGRVESILMSLPPIARWGYDVIPAPGSREDSMVRLLRQPKEWA